MGAPALALLTTFVFRPALAQSGDGWSPAGAPVASSVADRVFPVAVADGAGGAYVVWQEYAKIRMQRLAADGTIMSGWPAAEGLPVCSAATHGGYDQSSPRAVSDGAGGVYVLWHDERNSGCTHLCLGDPKQIYVQRIGPEGERLSGWPALGLSVGSALSLMSPTPDGDPGYAGEMNTVVVPDAHHGILVAWVEQAIRDNTEPGLHVQRVNAAGELLWGDRGLWICAAPGMPRFPTLAADGAGGAVVAWEDVRDPAGARIYVQRVSAAGAIRLAANGELATRGLERNERYPHLSSQGPDGSLLVWEAGVSGAARSLWARRLRTASNGSWSVPEVKITSTEQPAGTVSMLSDASGGAWVVWVDVRGGAPDIFVQRLLRVGKAAPGWDEGGVAVAQTPSAGRSHPLLAGDGAGEVFVAWRDADQPRAMMLTQNGRPGNGWPAGGFALTTETGVDRGLDLVFDGDSGVIGVWDQWMSHMGVDDVRAQRVGRMRASMRPAQKLPNGRFEQAAGPRAVVFALEGLRPNPSIGPVTVAFSLPSAGSASLEMFDVAGRRVAAADVGALGPGRHLVRLDTAARIGPGVYVIRLIQGDRIAMERGVVTR